MKKRRWTIAIIVEDDGIGDHTTTPIYLSKKEIIEKLKTFTDTTGVVVTRINVLNVETW